MLVAACSLALGENLSGGPDSADAATEQNDGSATTTDSGSSGTTDAPSGADAATDASADAAPPDPDLVGWWKLDETTGTKATDSSSFGMNEGTVQGTATWTNAGQRSGAFVFDGASTIDVASHPSLMLGTKVSIALWVRVDTDVDDARLIHYGHGWDVKLNGGHPQFETPDGYWVSKAVVAVGSWHHVAFTFDAGIVTSYYDGFPIDADTSTLEAGAGLGGYDYAVRLGATLGGAYAMKGALDDVRLYRRVLTAQDVDALVK